MSKNDNPSRTFYVVDEDTGDLLLSYRSSLFDQQPRYTQYSREFPSSNIVIYYQDIDKLLIRYPSGHQLSPQAFQNFQEQVGVLTPCLFD